MEIICMVRLRISCFMNRAIFSHCLSSGRLVAPLRTMTPGGELPCSGIRPTNFAASVVNQTSSGGLLITAKSITMATGG